MPGAFDNTEKELAGKEIFTAEVNGFSVVLNFVDGSRFEYEASDGGYSHWDLIPAGTASPCMVGSDCD